MESIQTLFYFVHFVWHSSIHYLQMLHSIKIFESNIFKNMDVKILLRHFIYF